ncbi:amino acid transporter [Thalassotalea euphylliae]|uniref:Amino acid transporter n=1 Tax=Thalassotalea euphylliae TaxID=1655234 RepID=A0A3E0TP01_9GAMM|nr:LysE/ArgO family amino acid transporter [Thalassotalea euphylliae]REL26279.1 amino acid transporter [Thalassotalea euphylliae]
MLATLTKGFVISLGLIMPLGAQNSYVLSQSIKKNHHLTAATVCFICDFLLMSLGVFGGGALIASNDLAYVIITWGGVAFLTFYGILFFRDAINGQAGETAKQASPSRRKVVIFTALAVTLLNPHVYLDTVVIIGSISGQYQGDDKYVFWAGTILASLTWFYVLSLGAAKLSPWLAQANVQRGINFTIAIVMWVIAYSLLKPLIVS